MSRPLLYVAYPMRLDLGAANAIQTYHTVRELRRLLPGIDMVIPRWLHEPSAFADLGAIHLPRPAVNKLSKFVPWAGWSYLERTLYSGMLVLFLVASRLRGRGYRVIYVRDAVCAAWLCLLRSVHRSRVIYEVHDLESLHPSKAPRWPRRVWARFLPWLDNASLRRADRLVSLTTAFKRWVVGQRIRREREIAVIPDAFDPNVYFPGDRSEARRALGLTEDAFIVGYAGLTFAYRRLDLLVRAFAALSGEGNNMLLALVGGRPGEVDEMRLLASDLGIAGDKLITPGQVSQKETALYLNAADALVIPDTVTGMTASPLKLFEYMAVGRAIICKDMEALREVLDDSSALFFQEGSVTELTDVLRRLKRDPELARELGKMVLERSAHYTYRARAEKIVGVASRWL